MHVWQLQGLLPPLHWKMFVMDGVVADSSRPIDVWMDICGQNQGCLPATQQQAARKKKNLKTHIERVFMITKWLAVYRSTRIPLSQPDARLGDVAFRFCLLNFFSIMTSLSLLCQEDQQEPCMMVA